MRTTSLFGVAISILFSTAVLALDDSTSFKVSGNCSIRKLTIENAAKEPSYPNNGYNCSCNY
ncbi:hypothetical protein SAMN05421813_10398 [Daejeonella rubra]|uniref:Uncharacterized protein n=1 Tax=Daejeonella rubra TaxID=990371 RepID=A0A1G9NMM6_9SPHI|nr:hypothetical protein [Daejeonella rubra]SDL87639.1 hypothetical protein SAMN05421813_10398 [Daejeonella rubra]